MLFIVKNQYNKIRKYIEADGNWVYDFSFITIDKKMFFQQYRSKMKFMLFEHQNF